MIPIKTPLLAAGCSLYGLKTIEAAAFKRMEELSDEEETQFHKTIR